MQDMSLYQKFRQLEEQGIDLVEILGQDSYLRSPNDLREILEKLLDGGEDLYTELLFFLTHRRFPASEAESLWHAILDNKKGMEDKLGRRVHFRTAAVDYLHSQTSVLEGVRILARSEMDSLLLFVNVDEVTAVYNRRFFNETLTVEIQRARRYGSPLSLLLLDLDNFKEVNDRYGHLEGDLALRRTGRLLRESTRQHDMVCRYGGDEFAVLLPEATNSEAFTLADRIRKAVGRLVITASGPESGANGADDKKEYTALTASIGGATFPTDCDESEDLVRLADQLCLEAKKRGKDQICMSGLRHPR